MEIRRLQTTDEREQSRSGDPDLDRFFHLYAGQNQFRHHVGTTYVAVEEGEILGYLTVAASSVEIEDLPDAVRRGLPHYPLPALRLARLAVDANCRGRGMGRELLGFALRLALRMAEEYGCIGVLVDAKPAAISFYAKFGFKTIETVEGHSEARPQPTLMFLATSEIRAAVRPGSPSSRR